MMSNILHINLFLLLVFSFFVSTIQSLYQIDSTQTFFQDTSGRIMIFHGVNVVVKLPPFIPAMDEWDPMLSFNDIDIDYLKKFGFNLVRLGITWESIERSEGTYDLDHLEKMSNIVKKLEENNIAVIIDAHQDMFSRIFCGEGVPYFYAKQLAYETKCDRNYLAKFYELVHGCKPLSNYNWTKDDKGLPYIKDCRNKGNFITYHQSPELASIYASFYNNQNGIMDSFAKFWNVLAEKFANRNNILGYDIWNEPWASNLWSDITALIPGRIDRNQVTKLYQTVDNVISQTDSNYTLFFESIPFPDILPLFGGRILPGFDKPPIDINKQRKQVYNTHNYCCASKQNICSTGEPPLEQAKNHCKTFHKRKIKGNLKQAKDMKIPMFVTEFGSCGDSEACYYEMLSFTEAADDDLVSWAYWMYKPFNDHTTTTESIKEGMFNVDGSVQVVKEKALTRTYVQAYQGYPLEMKFDDESKELTAEYILNPAIKGASVIYINRKLNYPNGYLLQVKNQFGQELSYELKEINENCIDIYIKKNSDDLTIVYLKLTAKTMM